MLGIHVLEINIIISIATSIMSLAIAVYAWTRRHVQGAYWFTGLVAAISWVTFWYALEASVAYDVDAYVTFSKMEYVGITFIPLLWLGFAISHGGKDRPFSRPVLSLLIVIPVITIALVLTNEWHNLIWEQPAFERGAYGPIFTPDYGGWFWVYMAYAYLIFLVGTVVLVRQALDLWHNYRARAALLLVGTALPWLSNLLETFDSINPVPELYVNAVFLGSGILAFAFALFRLHLLGLVPLAYGTVLNSVPDGLVVTDMRNRIVAVNQNAKGFLENPENDPIGKLLIQAFPTFPIDIVRPQNGDTRSQDDGTRGRWHYNNCTAEVRVAPVREASGKQRGWLFILNDVTAQMKTQAALRQSQQQLDAFFTQALDGFFFMMLDEPVRWDATVDKEAAMDYVFAHQRVTRANDAILEQYKTTREQVTGMTPNKLFADNIAQAKATWWHLFDHGHIQLEADMLRFDGSTMAVEGHYICLYDDEGRVTGHFGIQRDVTERNKSLRAIREAEHRYRALFEQSNDAVFILDFEGRHLHANHKAADLLGYTVEEIQHLSFRELSAEHGSSEGVLQRLLAGEQIPLYERVFRRKDGTTLPVEVNVELVHDQANEPLHIQSIIRDITERKKIEQQLRLQSAALEAAANAILITDPNGIIEWCNPAFTTLTGYTAEEALGKNPRELVRSGVHDAAFYKDMWETIQAGDVWEGQLVNLRKDGSLYTEEQIITPVRNTTGEISHFVAIKQDITERLMAQQKAFDMALEKERVELLAQFIQDTSHEFRTPLSIIQSSVYLMKRTSDAKAREQKGAVIQQQVGRINRLVEMLVEMSQLDSGLSFSHHPVNLNQLIQDVGEKIRQTTSHREQSVRLELDAELPVIQADPHRMMEALNQLVDNAVRFTPPDGTISLRTGHQDDHVFIDVQDSGPGITEEAMPRIFERFYRIDQAHTTPGFGLGLPIAQEIIRKHGGTIEVESRVGEGSRFRIVLPR